TPPCRCLGPPSRRLHLRPPAAVPPPALRARRQSSPTAKPPAPLLPCESPWSLPVRPKTHGSSTPRLPAPSSALSTRCASPAPTHSAPSPSPPASSAPALSSPPPRPRPPPPPPALPPPPPAPPPRLTDTPPPPPPPRPAPPFFPPPPPVHQWQSSVSSPTCLISLPKLKGARSLVPRFPNLPLHFLFSIFCLFQNPIMLYPQST